MPDWQPEITVDRDLAERLLRSSFRDLALRSLELVGEGWDNTVWLVDGEWAFRFPRREVAVPAIQRELGLLPTIGHLLPAPVPVPVFRGRPSDAYPWPFLGARFLAGDALGRSAVDEVGLAADLGRFLRTLHALEPNVELPLDPNRRADMPRRAAMMEGPLAALEGLGLWTAPPAARALLAEAVELGPPGRVTLAHGDLHFRHVLAGVDGRLAGVIDWGDACVASPGIDLVLYWSAFEADGRAALLDAYGPVTDDELVRARVLALGLNAILAEYGHREHAHAVRDAALAGLARTLDDCPKKTPPQTPSPANPRAHRT
jgi:aminoglycoside phosphotransferase (APT) family kinase protein